MWKTAEDWLVGLRIDDPADAAAFRAEGIQTVVGRLRFILPMMVVVHLVHVADFWLGPQERAVLVEQVSTWRDAITAIHLGSAAVAAVLAVIVWAVSSNRLRWAAPVVTAIYLMHGAAIAGADQLHHPTVAPYLAYASVAAMFLVLEPVHAALVYLVGGVALHAALVTFQTNPEIMRSMVFNGPSLSIALVVFATFLHRGRRREFVQRRTIESQAVDLQALADSLTQQVAEQVDALVHGTEEIHRLNRHLRGRVRDRSQELARALSQVDVPLRPGLAVGDCLDGRYDLLSTLGSGGMGVVFEALDTETDERVAVKVVRGRRRVSLELLRRFLREAEAVAALEHPGVVGMRAVDVAPDGTLYQVQELVRGEALDQVILRCGRLAPEVTASVLATLAEVLEHAHRHGVVHRDIKPANVMLTAKAPGLRLLDFGIARVRQELRNDDTAVTTFEGQETQVGLVMGTPGYMAPEQREGAEFTTSATDLYALGMLGRTLSTGRTPRPNASLTAVPGSLAVWVRRCLEPDQDRRPTATESVQILRALAGDVRLHERVASDTLGLGPSTNEATYLPDEA